MKKIIIIISMLASIASFADIYDFKPGNELLISIDWKETWRTISGQKYRDQKKEDLAFCILEYSKIENSFDGIGRMEEEGDISNEDSSFLIKMFQNNLKSVDLVCQDRLGKSKTNKLKASIFKRDNY